MYRKFLRPGWIVGHLMVVLAVLVCLRLGWWQWDRTHDADGTIQNLGYAILWPVFGAAFIYMWFRFLQLELVKDAEDEAELTELAAGIGITQKSDPELPQNISPDPLRAERVRGFEVDRVTGVESDQSPQTESATGDVGSRPVAEAVDESRQVEVPSDLADEDGAAVDVATVLSRHTPSRGFTIAVSTVGADDEDEDPELAAYNRALAALAEKDHRRAR